MSETLSDVDALVQVHPVSGNFWEQAATPSDVLLVSLSKLPAPADDSVRSLCDLPGSPKLVVLTESENAELRASLLAAGAESVLGPTPDNEIWGEALRSVIQRAREEIEERVQAEFDQPRAALSDFQSRNPVMQRFMQVVSRVAGADSSPLILGETGVGKERLARAIHVESPRCDRPFVPVNCAAVPEAQLESELFGYERGAFTGAVGDRRGYVELAHGGTLFLDEIAELHPEVQVKLLRVLQERVIQRLGSGQPTEINVRVMAATHRDLKEETKAGRFRDDLFYRLSVVMLEVPPLRHHPEDIPPLLERYLDEFRHSLGRPVDGFTNEALEALIAYAWPGNVRELINVVERSVLLCSGRKVTAADLPLDVVNSGSNPPVIVSRGEAVPFDWLPPGWRDLPWTQLRRTLLSACEQEYIHHHLTQSNGRVGVVAQRTGLSHRAVSLMMKRQGVRKEPYRERRNH